MRCLGAFFQVGGAKALEPVLHDISACCELELWGREPVVSYFASQGLSSTVVTAEVLGKERVECFDLVLTDTINMTRSSDAPLIGRLWEMAAASNIPSLAFVDSWWGYDNRFISPGQGARTILPEVIAVVDEIARQGMLDAGHPEGRLRILGSPHLDAVRAQRSRVDSRAQKFRQAHGLGGEFVCLFVSQPLERALGGGLEAWGFNELTTLEAICRQAALLPATTRDCFQLLILPHPEDDIEALGKVVAGLPVPCTMLRDVDALDAVCGADLVCGMFSILLTEAALLGRLVLSVQLGLQREDMLVTNMVGATRFVRTAAELTDVFAKLVCDPDYREATLVRQERFTVVGDSRKRFRAQLSQMGIQCQ